MSGRKLGSSDMAHLRKAGSWGLLRNLASMVVCLSGTMSMERTQMHELIEAAGGRCTNAMSGSVDLLVVADAASWTSKMAAAEDRGVAVLTETNFVSMLLPAPEELMRGERKSVRALLQLRDRATRP